MLGIANYHPVFYEDTETFRAAHETHLRELIGGTIQETWAVWHGATNKWFPDCPIIVQVGRSQIEMAAYQLGFSVTWGAINRTKPIRWYIDDDENDDMHLHWRERLPQPLCEAVGMTIKAIELWECRSTFMGDERWLFCGVGFDLGKMYLGVYNTLDELGFTTERQVYDYMRMVPL